MSDARSAAVPGDELLAHGEFVRRLARSLLRDVHLADDVSQDTLVAALTQPAPRGGSIRAWLAGIVRNRVRMAVRSDARRVRREQATSRPAAVPTADELVARLEVGRRLVGAVIALEEPYRTTVVLRFFDDLTPTEIAGRTGVPLDTVKTRLRRALAQLRDGLDRDEPGGRAAWCAALVPLVRDPTGPVGVPQLVGGVTVAAKSKLAVVAVALLGILAGAVGRDLLADGSRAPDGDASRAEAPQAQARFATAGVPAEKTDGRRAPGSAAAAASGGRLVVDLDVRRIADGDGRIRGRIATADGSPVEGASVTASRPADPLFAFPSADVRRDLEHWARATVEAEVRRRSRETVATTAADGTYEIVGLGTAPCRVTAFHEAFEIEAAGASDGRWARAGDSVDFVAVPVVNVPVEVVGPGEQRADEAVLAVGRAGTNETKTLPWTPDEPGIRLRQGTWTIQALARNGEFASSKESVEVGAAGAPGRLVLRLRERVGVRGRVVHPPVEGRDSVFVHLLRVPDGASPADVSARLVREGERGVAFGIFDFRFRFDDVEPGRYVLGASDMLGAVLATSDVVVGESSVWQDLVIPEPDDASFVTLRVLASDGTKVADADVQLAVGSWVPPVRFPSSDVVKQPDGTFRIRRKPETGARDPDTRIVVRSASLGRKEVPFDADAARPVEVRLEATATLAVAVTGGAGLTRGRVAVILGPAPGDGAAADRSFDDERRPLDDSSHVDYAALQPGEYELVTCIESDGGTKLRRVATERVTVRAGANQAAVALPALASLTVEVEGATGKEKVELSAMPGGSPVREDSEPVDREGRVVFDLLPPGRYHVSCTVGGGLCAATVELPQQMTVRLRPAPTEK